MGESRTHPGEPGRPSTEGVFASKYPDQLETVPNRSRCFSARFIAPNPPIDKPATARSRRSVHVENVRSTQGTSSSDRKEPHRWVGSTAESDHSVSVDGVGPPVGTTTTVGGRLPRRIRWS